MPPSVLVFQHNFNLDVSLTERGELSSNTQMVDADNGVSVCVCASGGNL